MKRPSLPRRIAYPVTESRKEARTGSLRLLADPRVWCRRQREGQRFYSRVACNGYTDLDTGEVVLYRRGAPVDQGHWLLHELTHQASPSMREEHVAEVARELWAIFTANPRVLLWLAWAAWRS